MKMKKVINWGKRNKILNEEETAKNINKDSQKFLELGLVQNEFLLSYKLQGNAYE